MRLLVLQLRRGQDLQWRIVLELAQSELATLSSFLAVMQQLSKMATWQYLLVRVRELLYYALICSFCSLDLVHLKQKWSQTNAVTGLDEYFWWDDSGTRDQTAFGACSQGRFNIRTHSFLNTVQGTPDQAEKKGFFKTATLQVIRCSHCCKNRISNYAEDGRGSPKSWASWAHKSFSSWGSARLHRRPSEATAASII